MNFNEYAGCIQVQYELLYCSVGRLFVNCETKIIACINHKAIFSLNFCFRRNAPKSVLFGFPGSKTC